MKLMIFSGTTEGHDLCRFLSKNSVQADVFVATEYGAAVMEPMARITVHEGRLDEQEMEKRLTSDTLYYQLTSTCVQLLSISCLARVGMSVLHSQRCLKIILQVLTQMRSTQIFSR